MADALIFTPSAKSLVGCNALLLRGHDWTVTDALTHTVCRCRRPQALEKLVPNRQVSLDFLASVKFNGQQPQQQAAAAAGQAETDHGMPRPAAVPSPSGNNGTGPVVADAAPKGHGPPGSSPLSSESGASAGAAATGLARAGLPGGGIGGNGVALPTAASTSALAEPAAGTRDDGGGAAPSQLLILELCPGPDGDIPAMSPAAIEELKRTGVKEFLALWRHVTLKVSAPRPLYLTCVMIGAHEWSPLPATKRAQLVHVRATCPPCPHTALVAHKPTHRAPRACMLPRALTRAPAVPRAADQRDGGGCGGSGPWQPARRPPGSLHRPHDGLHGPHHTAQPAVLVPEHVSAAARAADAPLLGARLGAGMWVREASV